MPAITRPVVWLMFSAVVFAQPIISPRSISNSAHYIAPGLPSGSIARGSLFSMFGLSLGPASSPPLSFPLSTTLGAVQVIVTQGATTVNAIPTYVSGTQINAIMPSNAPLGPVIVQVVYGGQPGTPSPANVVNASFGAYTFTGAGFGPAAMTNFVSATQQPLNTPTAPAKPGQYVTLYGTGLGPGLNADNVAPQQGQLPTPVELWVGGEQISVAYSGRSACCSGLDQINFQLPNDVAQGCWVPITIRTEGKTVSNTTTMSISADGTPCNDPRNAFARPFVNGNKLGVIALLRAAVTEDVGYTSAKVVTTDTIVTMFQRESAAGLGPFNPFFALPPAGSCLVYSPRGDMFGGDPIPLSGTTGNYLRAGAPVTLTVNGNQQVIPRPADNSRGVYPLGYTFTGSVYPSTLVLNPGTVNVGAPGGADVAGFQSDVNIAAPLTWTNRDQTAVIDRTQGFTVNWSGAPSGQQVIVFGGGVDLPSNGSSIFVCLAPAGANSFTVPSYVLGNIAPSRSKLLQSKGAVYVGALPTQQPTSIQPAGLDFGGILSGTFIGKTVLFQ